MNYTQTVAPTSEPLSLTDAKDFMRIIETDDDAMITSMIVGAREFAENYTNRQFVAATYELITDRFVQDMKLRHNPIKTISKIECMDETGVYQTLSTDEYYLYYDNSIGRIHFNSFPSIKDDKRAVKITFTSGYDTIPTSIVSFLKVFVSTIYENREFYIIGVSVDKFANPMIVQMLNFYRVQPL